MYPLYGLLIAAIFFFFERLIAIRKASMIEGNFMSMIRDHIMTGNVAAARTLAKNTNNPVAKMIDNLDRAPRPSVLNELQGAFHAHVEQDLRGLQGFAGNHRLGVGRFDPELKVAVDILPVGNQADHSRPTI